MFVVKANVFVFFCNRRRAITRAKVLRSALRTFDGQLLGSGCVTTSSAGALVHVLKDESE